MPPKRSNTRFNTKRNKQPNQADDSFADEMNRTPERTKTGQDRTPPSSGHRPPKVPRTNDQASVKDAQTPTDTIHSPERPTRLTEIQDFQTGETPSPKINDKSTGSNDSMETEPLSDSMSENSPASKSILVQNLNKDITIYSFYQDGHNKKPTVTLNQRLTEAAKPYKEYGSQEPTKDDLKSEFHKTMEPLLKITYPDRDLETLTQKEVDQFIAICDGSSTWPSVFRNNEDLKIKAGEACNMSYRLRITPPEIFGSLWQMPAGRLVSTIQTKVWRSAYNVYGSVWRLQTMPTRQAAPSRPKVSFNTYTNTNEGRLLGHNKKDLNVEQSKPTISNSLFNRKHKTYLSFILPPSSSDKRAQIEVDTHSNYITALGILRYSLHKAMLLPFTGSPSAQSKKPITLQDVENKLTTMEALKPYTDRIWPTVGNRVFVKVLIGHNEDPSLFDSDEFTDKVRSSEIVIYRCNVQAPRTEEVGWFLGSYPNTFDMRKFHANIQMHEFFGDVELDINTRMIKAHPRENREDPNYPKVRAVFVDCASENVLKVERKLKKLYNAKGRTHSSLPEGREMLFVPSTARIGRGPATPSKVRRTKQCRYKQQRYIASRTTEVLENCYDLDYLVNFGNKSVTLRQVIMSIKSCRNATLPLFSCVDQRKGESAQVVFSKDRQEEAKLMISVLPLVLEEALGQKAWQFFNPQARENMKQYAIEDGKVMDLEGDEFQDTAVRGETIFGDDDQLTDALERLDFERLEDVMVEEQDTIQFDIKVQINLDREPRHDEHHSTQSYDAGRSIATMTSGISQGSSVLPPTNPNLDTDAEMVDLTEDEGVPTSIRTNDSQSTGSSLTHQSRKEPSGAPSEQGTGN